jgi:AcrR family transcriptional regulator
MSKLGRPVGADPAQRRQQILVAALREFANRGYAGATVSRITHDAGITLGALYRYFAGKEELYCAVFAWSFGRTWDRIEAEFLSRLEQQESLVDSILGAIDNAAVALDSEDRNSNMFLSAVPIDARRSPELHHLVHQRVEMQHERLRRILLAARGDASLPDASFEMMVQSLRLLLLGWAIEAYHGDSHSEDLRKTFTSMLVALFSTADGRPVDGSSASRSHRRSAGAVQRA